MAPCRLQDQLKGVAHLEDKLRRKELDVVWAAYQHNKEEVKPQLTCFYIPAPAFSAVSDAGACPCVQVSRYESKLAGEQEALQDLEAQLEEALQHLRDQEHEVRHAPCTQRPIEMCLYMMCLAEAAQVG